MNDFQHNIDRQKAEKAGIRFFKSSEEQELFYLREALDRTPEERFLFMTMLMKIERQFRKSTSTLK